MASTHLCPHCPSSALVPDPFGEAALVCPLCQFTETVVPTPASPVATAAPRAPQALLAVVLGLGLLCFFAVPLLVFALSGEPAKVKEVAAVVPQPQPEPTPAPAPQPAPLPEPPVVPAPILQREPEPQPEPEKMPALPPLPPVAEKPPVVEKQPEPAPEPPPVRRVVGRLQKLPEEELRRQLEDVPEVNLDRIQGTAKSVVAKAKIIKDHNVAFAGPLANLPTARPDLLGLPMRMGKECRLGKEEAENLHALSRKLRQAFEQAMQDATTGRGVRAGAVASDPRIDADRLLRLMGASKDWATADAIPTLMQMMTPENKPVRKVLVELLARIDDKRATTALAMRAVTDLSPEVRQAALDALRTRTAADYRSILLAGLRYPVPAIAEQAAEALVALDDKESIPTLVRLLDVPAANLPIATGGPKSKLVVREVVKINHLGNCALCHQPSFDRTDLVRGAMPTPGTAIPAPSSTPAYYEGDRGDFVRADITYLRQDFSVVQPVPAPHNWPNFQRFDYLVRLRTPTPQELGLLLPSNLEKAKNPARDAVLFALKELTGQDLGKTSKDWATVTATLKEPPTNEELAQNAGREWRQFVTTLLPEMKSTKP